MILNFKSNDNLMAVKSSNNFGDQIILVVDISKNAPVAQRKLHPYLAGEIIYSNTESEGSHIDFSEKEILKRMA